MKIVAFAIRLDENQLCMRSMAKCIRFSIRMNVILCGIYALCIVVCGTCSIHSLFYTLVNVLSGCQYDLIYDENDWKSANLRRIPLFSGFKKRYLPACV